MTNIAIEYWSIERLAPYAANAKIHKDNDVDLIAQSIERFGFNDPIGVDPGGEIIEGHGRYLAAQKLGLSEVPVLIVPGLSDRQKRLYRIAHNKVALQSTFNLSQLIETLHELSGGDISLTSMGFTDASLAGLRWADEDRMRQIEDAETARVQSQIDLGEEGGEGVQHVAPQSRRAPSYEIIWDTPEQRTRWNRFMKALEDEAGSKGTGVLIGYIRNSGALDARQDEAENEQRATG